MTERDHSQLPFYAEAITCAACGHESQEHGLVSGECLACYCPRFETFRLTGIMVAAIPWLTLASLIVVAVVMIAGGGK